MKNMYHTLAVQTFGGWCESILPEVVDKCMTSAKTDAQSRRRRKNVVAMEEAISLSKSGRQ